MLLDVGADVPPDDQPTNVFLALRPEKEVSEEIHARGGELCARLGGGHAKRPPDILHVTLLGIGMALGRMPLVMREAIDTAVGRIRFPAFDVAFNQALTFRSSKAKAPFVLTDSDGATDAVALHRAARSALQVKGFRVPDRNIVPHLTLAYSSQPCPRTFVAPISWRAREFQLVESWTGRTKYAVLAKWSLWEGHQPSGC